MDTLESFLTDNEATLVFPLLARLNIRRNSIVYLPDDVALRYAADVLNISLKTILSSNKFLQILQYGVNPSGFAKGRDEEDRETIDGLSVLTQAKFNSITYKVLDGILARPGDVDNLKPTVPAIRQITSLPIQRYTYEQKIADMNKFNETIEASVDLDIDEDRISDEEVDEIKDQMDDFRKLIESEQPIGRDFKEINILLLGKTRAGKTTVAKMVQNLFQTVRSPTVFVGTINPGIIQVEIRYENTNYRINFIDTPGLFELTPSEEYNKGGPKRENEALLNLIREDLLASGITINAAFFCLAINEGLPPGGQDVRALERYLNIIDGLRWIAVSTHAEASLPEDRDSMREQIKEYPNKYISNVKVYFAGAIPDPSDLPLDQVEYPKLLRYLENIAEYRKHLLKYIAKIADLPPVDPSTFNW